MVLTCAHYTYMNEKMLIVIGQAFCAQVPVVVFYIVDKGVFTLYLVAYSGQPPEFNWPEFSNSSVKPNFSGSLNRCV